jgi:hypothetical protein
VRHRGHGSSRAGSGDRRRPVNEGHAAPHQERFGYGDIGDDPRSTTRRHEVWAIPLIFSQSSGDIVSFEKLLLEEHSTDVQLFERIDWTLVNTEGTGFYRAQYAPTLREALVARAQAELSPIERYGLVDDAWAAVLADRLTSIDFLELVTGFDGETTCRCGAHDRRAGRATGRRRRARARLQKIVRCGRPGSRSTGSPTTEGRRLRRRAWALFDLLGVLGCDADLGVARAAHASVAERPPWTRLAAPFGHRRAVP